MIAARPMLALDPRQLAGDEIERALPRHRHEFLAPAAGAAARPAVSQPCAHHRLRRCASANGPQSGIASISGEGSGSCANGSAPTTRPSSTTALKAPQCEWLDTSVRVIFHLSVGCHGGALYGRDRRASRSIFPASAACHLALFASPSDCAATAGLIIVQRAARTAVRHRQYATSGSRHRADTLACKPFVPAAQCCCPFRGRFTFSEGNTNDARRDDAAERRHAGADVDGNVEKLLSARFLDTNFKTSLSSMAAVFRPRGANGRCRHSGHCVPRRDNRRLQWQEPVPRLRKSAIAGRGDTFLIDHSTQSACHRGMPIKAPACLPRSSTRARQTTRCASSARTGIWALRR